MSLGPPDASRGGRGGHAVAVAACTGGRTPQQRARTRLSCARAEAAAGDHPWAQCRRACAQNDGSQESGVKFRTSHTDEAAIAKRRSECTGTDYFVTLSSEWQFI